MPKIVLTGDIHLGYIGRLDDILYSLKAIRTYMQEQDISYAMILGDLFHTRQGVASDVMHRTFEFFEDTKNKYNQSWAVFPGNHDMFLKHSWKIHSLKALSTVLDVYDKPCKIDIEGSKFWILPYIHDEATYMKAVGAISKECDANDVLLTHVGVCGATLNECFLHKNWSVVSFADFPLSVYSGHFHCTQQVGRLWYPGSPIPFTYAEGLVDHGFFVYNTDTATHEFIKTFDVKIDDLTPPPLFTTIPDKDIDTLEESDIKGNKIRVMLGHEYTTDERIALKSKLESMGAKEVAWMKVKEKEVNVSGVNAGASQMADPQALLKTWYELDKPEHVELDKLLEINKDIIIRAAELMAEKGRNMEHEDA